MVEEQFQDYQSQLYMLTPQQLKSLQNQIEGKLLVKKEPLLTDEEALLISSLFHRSIKHS